jgi:TIR domain
MKRLFVWASLLTGVLPGIAVILNGFGTPEDFRKPFGIIAAACGFVAFGVVALTKETVNRGNRRVLAGLIIASALIGLGSLCVYWIVLDQCVFQSPQRSGVFFPLWLEGRAKEKVESAGGRKAYYENYGAGAVSTLLEDQTVELNRTKWLLLVLICSASVTLPTAGGIMAAFPDGQRRPKPFPSTNVHGIYLSYRRTESAAYAGRLFDHLSRHFSPGSVFMDIQGGIAPGQDFARAIESALNACDAVLVVIGNSWTSCTGKDARRRLDDPKDWVRLEVAAALRRNVLVVPILVDAACLPDPASLPEELQPLCGRNACELSDLRWSFDVGELVKYLEKVVRLPKGSAGNSP